MDLNAWLNKDLPSVAEKLESINLSNLINENTIGFAGERSGI